MKKKLYLLAMFIALNVAAQSSLDTSNDLNVPFAFTEHIEKIPANPAISLHVDAKKEIIKVQASAPISELIIKDLYGRKLIRKKRTGKIKLSSLPRGVYELEVNLKGATVRKRIILE